MRISEFRQVFTEYDDLSDKEVGDLLYKKFFEWEMPKENFDLKFYGPTAEPEYQSPLAAGVSEAVRRIPSAAHEVVAAPVRGVVGTVEGAALIGRDIPGIKSVASGLGALRSSGLLNQYEHDSAVTRLTSGSLEAIGGMAIPGGIASKATTAMGKMALYAAAYAPTEFGYNYDHARRRGTSAGRSATEATAITALSSALESFSASRLLGKLMPDQANRMARDYVRTNWDKVKSIADSSTTEAGTEYAQNLVSGFFREYVGKEEGALGEAARSIDEPAIGAIVGGIFGVAGEARPRTTPQAQEPVTAPETPAEPGAVEPVIQPEVDPRVQVEPEVEPQAPTDYEGVDVQAWVTENLEQAEGLLESKQGAQSFRNFGLPPGTKESRQQFIDTIQPLVEQRQADPEVIEARLQEDPQYYFSDEDIGAYNDAIKETRAQRNEQVDEYNQARAYLQDQFASNRGASTRAIKSYEDPSQIPGFDELVQTVRDDPALEAALTQFVPHFSSTEDLVFQALKAPKQERFKNASPEVIQEVDAMFEGYQGENMPGYEPEPVRAGTDIEQEFAGIPLNVRVSIPRLKRSLKKWLLPRGLFTKQQDTMVRRATGEAAMHVKMMQHLSHNLRRVLPKNLTESDLRVLDDALKGETKGMQSQPWFTDEIGVGIQAMRNHVDQLSRITSKLEGIDGTELGIKIEENQKQYITRTYKKHRIKNFAQKLEEKNPEIIEQAREELMADGMSERDADGMIKYLMDKDSADARAEMTGTISRSADVLMKRKDIPEAIRELMGENRDPFANYLTTVEKLASLNAQRQLASDFKAVGLQQGWIAQKNKPTPEAYRPINIAGNRALEPLKGLVADPEFADALHDFFSVRTYHPAIRWMMKLSATSKWAATVGSWKSSVRNYQGNIAFAIANGDYRGWNQAMKVWRDGTPWKTTDRGIQGYVEELVRLGVLDTDVAIGQITDLMELSMKDPDAMPDVDQMQAHWRRMGRSLADWYQAQDNFWKVLGFESNRLRYKRLLPNLSESQLARKAAEIVQATYPTYARAPRAVKALARFPFLSPFVMFQAEVARTSINRTRIALEEIKSDNKALRKNGYMRLLNQAVGMSAWSALATVASQINGVGSEEEEDVRKVLLAPWSRNSSVIAWRMKDGNYSAVDLGYTDPFATFKNPLKAALRGESALSEIATDTIGEDIFWGAVGEALFNKKLGTGGKVYKTSDDFAERTLSQLTHVSKTLIPATLNDLNRIYKGIQGKVGQYKSYDPMVELTSFTTGYRRSVVEPKVSWDYKARDFNRQLDSLWGDVTSEFKNTGKKSLKKLAADWVSAKAKRRELLRTTYEHAMSANRLGVSMEDIAASLQTRGFAKYEIGPILRGEYVDKNISKELIRAVGKTPDGEERLEILLSD